MLIDAAPGDVIDRLTILELKLERIADPTKLKPVRLEHAGLAAALAAEASIAGVEPLRSALKSINAALWQVEDDLRDCERAGVFGHRFIELARSVYRLNDQRCALKQKVNEAAGSALTEIKSYVRYE